MSENDSRDLLDHYPEINEQAFRKVDDIVKRIEQFQVRPDFPRAVMERANRTPDFGLADDAILKKLIRVIAYSNNAKAKEVGKIMDTGILDRIFRQYNVGEVAILDPDQIVQHYWSRISGIRFRGKVKHMIGCAKYLVDTQSRHGSFMQYLREQHIPTSIQTMSDLRSFWNRFDLLLAGLKAKRAPYLGSFISLCHLLMDLGYDCAKPDSVVMKVGAELQIAPPPKKPNAFPKKERRKVVQFMQIYAMCRGTRTSVVDLYFLIHGEQTNAIRYVQSAYYL